MTPTYYAAGWRGVLEFEVLGSGFDYLPAAIKGTVSDKNDVPAEHVDAEAGAYMLTVVERSAERLLLRGVSTETYNRAVYLGTISEVGKAVALWENTTRPLP